MTLEQAVKMLNFCDHLGYDRWTCATEGLGGDRVRRRAVLRSFTQVPTMAEMMATLTENEAIYLAQAYLDGDLTLAETT